MFKLAELKVCFLAGTLERGGAERQLVYMLRALRDAGAEARLLCLTRGEALEEEIKGMGVPVEFVGESGSRPVRLCRIVRELRRRPADVIQSAHFYTNLYVGGAGRLTRTKSVGAIRSDLFSELRANGILGRVGLFLPSHLIANSDLALQRAIVKGVRADRISLVRNAAALRSANGGAGKPDASSVRVLFVGRLIELKRPEVFVRVMSRVAQQLPGIPVKAVIAGDGPLKSTLERMAPTLGLGPDRLELLGEKSNVDEVYGSADLLMLTSAWEGTPNVILEAMGHGLPVVATRVGGVPNILTEDRGVVVNPGDEDALTAAAVRLVADPALRARLGRRGQEYVAGNHSLDALAGQLASVYERVLGR